MTLVTGLLPESQCGFRRGLGTVDMIFSARQLRERCIELHASTSQRHSTPSTYPVCGLFFASLVALVNVIRSFHDGIFAMSLKTARHQARSLLHVEQSKAVYQLHSSCFSTFFSVMLYVEYKDCGIPLAFQTDQSLFNLRKLKAETRVYHTALRELLFADDCALSAHTCRLRSMTHKAPGSLPGSFKTFWPPSQPKESRRSPPNSSWKVIPITRS